MYVSDDDDDDVDDVCDMCDIKDDFITVEVIQLIDRY